MTFITGFAVPDRDPDTSRREIHKGRILNIRTIGTETDRLQMNIIQHVKKELKSATGPARCLRMLSENQAWKILRDSVRHVLPGSMLILHLEAF